MKGNKVKNVLISFVVVLLTSSLSLASVSKLNFAKETGKVEFTAKGPLIKVKGDGEGVSGTLLIEDNKVSGELALRLDSLNTGISLRDDHMKNKNLQTPEYPTAVLKLKDVSVPKNLKGKAKFKGVLSLHGVEKAVEGSINMKGVKKGAVKIKADFKIKFKDFNIIQPSFKLVTVGEDLKIKFSGSAVASAAAVK